MAGRINKKSIQNLVLNSAKTKKFALESTKQIVDIQKNELLNNFLSHPVTQEIQAGEKASNISHTLGGYGNLFSFIGFSNGYDPINPIVTLLNSIKVKRNVSIKRNKFIVSVVVPSKEDLAKNSRMPWETSRSWLWDIERSISGIGSYLYGKFEQSRSGTGLQSRKSSKNRTFSRVAYFTPLYNRFINKIGGKLK